MSKRRKRKYKQVSAMDVTGMDVRVAIVSRLFALKNKQPESPIEFFIDYAGHVDYFAVRIYLKGWSVNVEPDIVFSTDNDRNTAYTISLQPKSGRDLYDIIKDAFAGMTKDEIRNKYKQMLYHED